MRLLTECRHPTAQSASRQDPRQCPGRRAARTASEPPRTRARTIDEYEHMSGMFDALYPDAAIPKGAWRWIESAQYRLLRQGAHRALSAMDLLICATAAQHDLVVLHDDKDFATAARYLPDVRERTIHDAPHLD